MMRIHEDPGHAWLEVARARVLASGTLYLMSDCSHVSRDGATLYLEEDCDLTVFMAAYARQLGRHPVEVLRSIPTTFHQNDAPCRSLPRLVNPRRPSDAALWAARRYAGEAFAAPLKPTPGPADTSNGRD